MRSGLPRLLRSRGLALTLLIAIAALAIVGTLPLPEAARSRLGQLPAALAAARAVGLVDTYRSPLFLALTGALCLNVILCTWQRVVARSAIPAGAPSTPRGNARRVLDALVHLSLLAIVAGGAAKGSLGFVRTMNIQVGQSADAFYDFALDAEVPLGFTLEVLDREDTYYPLQVLIGVSDRDGGRKIDLVELREGRAVHVPGVGLTLEIGEQIGEPSVLRLQTTLDGRTDVATLAFAAEGEQSTTDVGALRLALVAWKRELKSVRTRLACRENGVRTHEGWVSPQRRIACGGVSFAQTAWGVDEFGNRFAGIQAVREPGAAAFWAGCVTLALALPLFVAVRAAPGPGPWRGGGEPNKLREDAGR